MPMIADIRPNADLIVRDTGTAKGRGVFAGRAFLAGEVVETSPVVAVDAPKDLLPRQVLALVFNWDLLCGRPQGPGHALALGVGSLFNHAQQPNLGFVADTQLRALVFSALVDIPAGTELTIDYNADIGQDPDWFQAMDITPLP